MEANVVQPARMSYVLTRHEIAYDQAFRSHYDAFQSAWRRYAEKQGWREGVGTDAYDELGSDTRYLIVANHDGRFEAGARVTPVADLSACRSIGMWAGVLSRHDPAVSRQLAASAGLLGEIKRNVAEGRVWDATRLVTRVEADQGPNPSIEHIHSHSDIIRLVGMIAGVVGLSGRTLYTATRQLYRFLAEASIPSEVVLDAIINPARDELPSYLCFADPGKWYANVKHVLGARTFEEGYRAARKETTIL
jgi:hypothetical protein